MHRRSRGGGSKGRVVTLETRAKLSASNTKHGLRRTPIYKLWTDIKQRCLNPNNPAYPDYGGRGIKICKRWCNNVENFNADILAEIGPKPKGKTLDRYPDNDGDYKPGNVRWATHSQQMLNRRPYSQKWRVKRSQVISAAWASGKYRHRNTPQWRKNIWIGRRAAAARRNAEHRV